MNWLDDARWECLILNSIKDMVAWREKEGLTLKQMSLRSGISVRLLELIEGGGVTHPDIARRFVAAYEFPEEYIQQIIPKNYRKDSDEYDPDRYRRMENVDGKDMFRIYPKKLDEADIYVAEHQKELRKKKYIRR